MEKDTTIGLEAAEDLIDNMKTFGPLYVGTINYYKNKELPLFEVGTTQESEPPYRLGKCLIYKRPRSFKGHYLGIWIKNPRLSEDNYEEIDKLLIGALTQYSREKNPKEFYQMYRSNVNFPDKEPKYVRFLLNSDTSIHVYEHDQQAWWDSKRFATTHPWEDMYASRCKEHKIPALLSRNVSGCFGWHLEKRNALEGTYEPVL